MLTLSIIIDDIVISFHEPNYSYTVRKEATWALYYIYSIEISYHYCCFNDFLIENVHNYKYNDLMKIRTQRMCCGIDLS